MAPMTGTAASNSENPPAPRAAWLPGAKSYDLLAASPLILWYSICLVQQFPQICDEVAAVAFRAHELLPLVDLLSRCAAFGFSALFIALMVTRRPATAKAQGLFPRMAAFLGCYLGVALLVLPRHPGGWLMEVTSTALILGGTSIALLGLLWLGRSISIMSEARRLVVTGPYSIVRHPLYLGEQLAVTGVALQFVSPLAIALLALQFSFQLYRMGFEEQILSETFPEYEAYKARTSRLIPGIY
jgi:protein-S-isoprenylcysteine O-methyltransferase Ste14